jgi:hypothetical protein
MLCCAVLALGGGAAAQSGGANGSIAKHHSVRSTAAGKRLSKGKVSPSSKSVPSAVPASVGTPGEAEPVSLQPVARRVMDAAGAFDGYMRRTAAISAKFTGGEAVNRAVELGSVYQPRQLQEGAIAYAALVAVQDSAFVAAVREVGHDPSVRQRFIGRLVDHPETVLEAAAARRAATWVSGVLARMGTDMVEAGAAVKQASYDLQSRPWSKQADPGLKQRLARIEAQSSMPRPLAPGDAAQLTTGLTALRSDHGSYEEATAVTPVVARGLALAALVILGVAGDDQEQQFAPLLSDETDAECIKMAELNAFQCLAVARPQYEDIFCLGNHAMMDSGRCIVAAAGMSDRQPWDDRAHIQ